MLQKLYVFFRKETVLSIAVILALLSMFWVRPDKAYFTYIDFRTLGLLFCLMAIVAGLKAVGVFDILAKKLLMGTSGTVGVIRLLVLLCFFLSMVITNDVALITFVPLALIIVHKLPKELGNYWLLKIVAMQTIAAKKQGKYKQGGLLPACHLYRIIYFYRQPWKDSAIQQFSGKNHGRKGNTYCCSCQSDYEQCSRCASFIRLYR